MIPIAIPFIVAAVVSAISAALVLYASFDRPANRALALFLVIFGALNACIAMFFVSPSTLQQAYWYRVAWYFGLVDAPVLLWLVATYPRPRRRLPRWTKMGTTYLILIGMIGLAYVMWRESFFQYEGPASGTSPISYLAAVEPGPLLLLDRVFDLIFPLVAMVFARDAFENRGLTARSSLLLAVGLPLLFLYRRISDLTALAVGNVALEADTAVVAQRLLDGLQLLFVLALVAYLLSKSRDAPPEIRKRTRHLLLLPGAVAILAIFAGATGQIFFATPLAILLEGVVFLLGPAVITYGLLTRQIVDIDLHAKHLVRRGTLLVIFLAAYATVVVVAQPFTTPTTRSLLGVGAALLLLIVLIPLRRVAGRAADAALPGVDASSAHLNLRRLEIYRAEVEMRLTRDGDLMPDDEQALAALRRDLDLSERDHVVLLLAVRGLRSAASGLALASGEIILDHYRVHGLIGSGSSGKTYLAEDMDQGHRVAIKVFHRGPEVAEDVVREARAVAGLDHPNVVAVHDVETFGDEAFLVMDHCEGGSLANRLGRGPLGDAEFHRVAEGLLSALEAVHRVGIHHRDVKPGNVLLAHEGQPKLADFGIAHTPDLASTQAGGATVPLGTLAYASPEQARGHRYTARSDLYSAAATLYEAYTGHPYQSLSPGETAWDLQVSIAQGTRFPLDQTLPDAMRTWFMRALDPRPSARFQDARTMSTELRHALGSAGTFTPQRSRAETGRHPRHSLGEADADHPAARPSS